MKAILMTLVMTLAFIGAQAQAGINWTLQTSTPTNNWRSVTYGNGLFVAVAQSGTGNRVMTSPDGITWTSRTSAADNVWLGLTYANGLFVAVSSDGTGDRVMTSPDGITWTSRTSAADNVWYGVTYGNGLFVAVAANGTGNNRVMTSGTFAAAPIPTLSQWGLIIFTLLLLSIGTAAVWNGRYSVARARA